MSEQAGGEIKVSVCMVTYNHERYIAQAIESALAQRVDFPLEIVIGEDCSTDRTREIVRDFARRYPETIRPRLPAKNQGGSPNFVNTFAECRGKYVVILEGDDYFLNPNKLQIQADKLDERPDWAIHFHPVKCIYSDGITGADVWPDNFDREEATIHDLFEDNFIPTSGCMFRNRLFDRLPDWFTQTNLGDWPLNILNAAHGNIGFTKEPMSAYRKHAGGLWTGMDRGRQLMLTFRMFSMIDHHFGGKYRDEIYKHRYNTLHWLMHEVDQARVVNQYVEGLESDNRQLTELNERYEAMVDMTSYRVVREIMRPWKQFRSRLDKFLGREVPEEPPQDLATRLKRAA
ncbi:glycosyltransferase [Lacipirellula sp.]|uniref:glycosyltransferase n=1 Tax=Lacipirellula sp. TaxID=2691419 RepID=UPI003D0FAAD8